jgi:hypothetical protein
MQSLNHAGGRTQNTYSDTKTLKYTSAKAQNVAQVSSFQKRKKNLAG